MADVKWIKITTDIFDDEKIILIESLPDAYAIITVWFKLLCLAGKQNNSGVFMLGRIAYTDRMLATIFRMKESTVTMALHTFEEFGMIEIVDGVITIPNWGKHQSLDAYEKKKAYDRQYRMDQRAKQKLLAEKSCDNRTISRTTVVVPDKEKEEELEKDLDIKSVGAPAEAPPTPEFGPVLQEAFEDWLKYKRERREAYKPTGLKSLATQIKNQAAIHGEEAVASLIRQCMASNWKGIIFDRLQGKTQSYGRSSTGFETSNPFAEMLAEERGRR